MSDYNRKKAKKLRQNDKHVLKDCVKTHLGARPGVEKMFEDLNVGISCNTSFFFLFSFFFKKELELERN